MKKQATFKVGDRLTLEIEKIVFPGEGFTRYEGFVIFVPLGIPGERVEVEVISLKKNYARALIKKIITPSEDRIDPNKYTFEALLGCDFGMLTYPKQLEYKNQMLKEVLCQIGELNIESLPEILPSPTIYNYRNKSVEPFGIKDGQIITGFYKRKSHDVFEVEENILQDKMANFIISRFKELANLEELNVYNENKNSGLLKSIMVRTNSHGKAMLILIIFKKLSRKLTEILEKLYNEVEELESIFVSIHSRPSNRILGEELIHIKGEKFIREDLLGINFNITPDAFFQINYEQTKNLYQKALSLFTDIEDKTIVDAYSGTGTIGMIMSSKAKKVYGIELVKGGTISARKTAKENNIQNTEFINGSVEKELGKLLDKGVKLDGIIFDPPRKGIAKEVLLNVAKYKVPEFVYISCNPSTFSRDAKILKELGYDISDIQGVDMFPHTAHIELVAKFTLK